MNAIIHRLKRKYILVRSLEVFLTATGMAMILFVVFRFFEGNIPSILIAVLGGLGYAVLRIHTLQLLRLSDENVASWLNTRYPELAQSTDLLLVPLSSLNSLERIQLPQVTQRLDQIGSSVTLPHRLGQSVIILLAGVMALTIPQRPPEVNTNIKEVPANTAADKPHPSIGVASVEVVPPAYTHLAKRVTNTFRLKIPEQSKVTWSVTFTNPVKTACLVFSGKDTMNLSLTNGQYAASRIVNSQGFYTLHWKDSMMEFQSDFFPLEVVPDQPPLIDMGKQPAYTEVGIGEKAMIPVTAKISDDYGVTDAVIVATVAKGSGESVKFREEVLRFSSPQRFQEKDHTAFRNLDVMKLGLEPGDELYYYVEATDGKVPKPNHSRTETYFITVKDSARMVAVADEGLGVDLMPDYFRSQRQIIIDSEKLLKEKSKIKKEEFNSRSNELGYDQKVLRLRYGQFLGEEFESGIVGSLPENEEEDEDPLKRFGHQHDKDNEHNLVADKDKNQKAPAHDHAEKSEANESQKESPLDAFIHQHDNTEEATFFAQSVKAKLRAALTLMWDAELHLRLYAPEKSLPYQYKILKLLKEISNDSRIYVHRTGFDPPPIKEEKRLTGDLSELKNSNSPGLRPVAQAYPAIRIALAEMETFMQSSDSVPGPALVAQLQAAGVELAGLTLIQPGQIEALSLLKGLMENRWHGHEREMAWGKVRTALWQLLPQYPASPGKGYTTRHSLEEKFLKNLEPAR